ncbi:hypothetical protein MtrunA17_Chr4g0021181 [Medicago truncatula]|uniref:Uncharacterized protein n=1 Tax=Medicago truncatula TaxID=3880 RepID=A0A396I5M1_MEDTR|nr:hypothetical protein MtrunA17_Chr4g0021181 [Medicago truncatula]
MMKYMFGEWRNHDTNQEKLQMVYLQFHSEESLSRRRRRRRRRIWKRKEEDGNIKDF